MPTETTPTHAHAKLGASSAHRWTVCPGSIALCKDLPNPSSLAAAEGTLAHELAAKILTKGRIARKNYPSGMATNLRPYIEYIRAHSAGGFVWVEQQVKIDEDLWGTADAIIVQPRKKTLEVVDLKYGQGVVVEVDQNPQLLFYALGAYLTLRTQYPEMEIETVRYTIIQPRAEHAEGPVRSASITVDDLRTWGLWLIERAKATQQPEAVLVVGDHCRYCPGKGYCPERVKALSTVQEAVGIKGLSLKPVNKLSHKEKEAIMRVASALEDYLSDVKARVYGDIERGEAYAEWQLAPTRARRVWASEDLAKTYLLQNTSLRWDDIALPGKLLSPLQILRKVGTVQAQELERYIESESRGVKLAPRPPAITQSRASDFDSEPHTYECDF